MNLEKRNRNNSDGFKTRGCHLKGLNYDLFDFYDCDDFCKILFNMYHNTFKVF